jgi:Tol biopolymer transport system component
MTRLTDAGANFRPSWSPDARRVYFLSTRIAGRLGIYARQADGSTAEERIHDHPGHIQEVLISRDTTWMLFRTGSGGTETNIYARRFTGDTSTIEIAASDRYRESSPTLSPDARWIAYASNETGRHEVYIQPFPNVAGGKWPVSTNGGDEPLWSRDGRELFYRNGAGEMVAVEILSDGSPPIGQQRALFSTLPYLGGDAFHRYYDVTPDRQRFVMLRRPTGQGVEDTRLIVVENFLEELRAKVPR